MSPRAIIPLLSAIDFRALQQSAVRELRWLWRRFFDRSEAAPVEIAQPEASARPLRDGLAKQIEEMRAQLRKNGAEV